MAASAIRLWSTAAEQLIGRLSVSVLEAIGREGDQRVWDSYTADGWLAGEWRGQKCFDKASTSKTLPSCQPTLRTGGLPLAMLQCKQSEARAL